MMLKLRRSVERNSQKRAKDAFRELKEDVLRHKQEQKNSDG
jgi:ribosomal protein L31E